MMNGLVMGANDGKMPVATQKDDILFVIGPAQFGVTNFPSVDDFDEQHRALTEHTTFRILADRIPLSFKFIHKERLPALAHRAFDAMNIPAGQDIIASPGDLFLWAGLSLAYTNLLLVLVYILAKIFFGMRRKK